VTDLEKLLVGFLLTSVLGGLLTFWLNRLTFARQARLDLLRRRHEEGVRFLDDLSSLVDRRLFALQRFLWAVDSGDPERLARHETAYFETVAEWNGKLRSNRNKARLLVGQKFADDFLDYSDDQRLDAPRSLHYHFALAHRSVLAAKSRSVSVTEAHGVLDRLNWHCSDFLEALTTDFTRQSASLAVLEVPPIQPRLQVVTRG